MRNSKGPLPEFPRDVKRPVEKISVPGRFMNAGIAVIFGIVFVHILFHGSMVFARVVSGEAFYWFKNPYFVAIIGLCALFGWFKGQKFTRWFYEEISYLKFW